jgi:hypothetical protein
MLDLAPWLRPAVPAKASDVRDSAADCGGIALALINLHNADQVIGAHEWRS